MRKILLVSTLLTAASLYIAVPAPAIADDSESWRDTIMDGGCGMMEHDMMGFGHMMGGHGWGRRGGMEGRLAYLKDELEITAAQADAWKDYAEAVTARADAMRAARHAIWDAMEKGGVLERIDARISGMETMLQSLKSVRPAVEKLYDALDDDQKTRADDLLGVGCGAM